MIAKKLAMIARRLRLPGRYRQVGKCTEHEAERKEGD